MDRPSRIHGGGLGGVAVSAVMPPSTGLVAGSPLKVEHPTVEALRMFLRNPAAIGGMTLMLVILVVAIAGPWVYPADPFEIRAAPLTPPFGEDAWLGTDYLGRDVLTMLVYGGRATLLVGAVAALLSVAIGRSIGAFAGYYGGRVDGALMRLTDFFQVLPALLAPVEVVGHLRDLGVGQFASQERHQVRVVVHRGSAFSV